MVGFSHLEKGVQKKLLTGKVSQSAMGQMLH